jgi:DNA-binding GntR family transcriptional regulator
MVSSALVDIELDRSTPTPLYYQVAREIERAITDGRLAKGDYLQSETVLADSWQVSRLTLRRSVQELVDSGLLVRRQGKGTQVVNDEVPGQTRLSSIWDDLTEQHRSPTTTVLAHDRVIVDDAIAEQLAVPMGSEVVYLERCRYADGHRLAIMRSWLTMGAGGGLTTAQLASAGLYKVLRERGIWPHSARRKVSARLAGPVDAALLGIARGAPLLIVESTMQDFAGTRVEYTEQVLDATRYTMDLMVVES